MSDPAPHEYLVEVRWTGNRGEGTASYRAYDRDHEIVVGDRPVILGSSDPAFRGDPRRYNPEELLVASLSACHMLWYLHLCAVSKIVVTEYVDRATGSMAIAPDGHGQFTTATLRPIIAVRPGCNLELAQRLHDQAHEKCFIARSVNFPVRCEPTIRVAE